MTEIGDLLKSGLEKIGIEWEEEDIRVLELYVSEIELWNKKHSFVKASGRDLVIDHILDSLAPLPVLRKYRFGTLADAGSGAGLPGIPLALFFKDKKITLVERSGKRAGFLRNEVGLLRLTERVSVTESAVEDVHDRFDAVTFRAFRQLEEYIGHLFNILRPEGYLFAYKGRRRVIEEELSFLDAGICREIVEVKVPFSSKERHMVILQRNR